MAQFLHRNDSSCATVDDLPFLGQSDTGFVCTGGLPMKPVSGVGSSNIRLRCTTHVFVSPRRRKTNSHVDEMPSAAVYAQFAYQVAIPKLNRLELAEVRNL
jgi:hypothetical protein